MYFTQNAQSAWEDLLREAGQEGSLKNKWECSCNTRAVRSNCPSNRCQKKKRLTFAAIHGIQIILIFLKIPFYERPVRKCLFFLFCSIQRHYFQITVTWKSMYLQGITECLWQNIAGGNVIWRKMPHKFHPISWPSKGGFVQTLFKTQLSSCRQEILTIDNVSFYPELTKEWAESKNLKKIQEQSLSLTWLTEACFCN